MSEEKMVMPVAYSAESIWSGRLTRIREIIQEAFMIPNYLLTHAGKNCRVGDHAGLMYGDRVIQRQAAAALNPPGDETPGIGDS